MNEGVANMIRLGGLTLRDAVRTATLNPARLINLEGRMRGLEPGDLADVVSFRMDGGAIRIEAVYLDGRHVV